MNMTYEQFNDLWLRFKYAVGDATKDDFYSFNKYAKSIESYTKQGKEIAYYLALWVIKRKRYKTLS